MRQIHPKQPKGKTAHAQAERKAEREAKAVEKRRLKFRDRTPNDSPYLDTED